MPNKFVCVYVLCVGRILFDIYIYKVNAFCRGITNICVWFCVLVLCWTSRTKSKTTSTIVRREESIYTTIYTHNMPIYFCDAAHLIFSFSRYTNTDGYKIRIIYVFQCMQFVFHRRADKKRDASLSLSDSCIYGFKR